MGHVYQAHFQRVRRAVARSLREPADQDNVVQQVFMELIEKSSLRASYQGGDLGAWLCAIASHKAIDFGRRQARLVQYDVDKAEETQEPNEPLNDFRKDLERFAQTQDAQQQQLLRLRFIEGHTQIETAAAMQIPRSTLEDWEHQLKSALRTFLLGSGGKRSTK